MKQKAVILLSGGLDSTTALYWAKDQDIELYPLYVDYESTHKSKELDAAKTICDLNSLPLRITTLDLRQFINTPLTNKDIKMPTSMHEANQTVVPFRNMLLIAHAAIYCREINADTIITSPTQDDYATYRDCRPTFFNQLEQVLSEGSDIEKNYTIITPFIHKTKAEVVDIGIQLKVPFDKTWTCYKGEENPCKTCPACIGRQTAFNVNKQSDPLLQIDSIDRK